MTNAAMVPRVMICGHIQYAQDDAKALFAGIAEIITMNSPDRADFLAGMRPGGKYDGIVGIYRRNMSRSNVGVFDRELVCALAPSVKRIAQLGAGYDQIDITACKEKGIFVSNTPGAVNDVTATTALYLMISSFRHFPHVERTLRGGTWKTGLSYPHAHDLTNKTLAILGLGGIGLRLAELAHAFPMRVIYHSRSRVADAPEWAEYFPAERLDDFLGAADVLSVHVPLRKETEGLVGEQIIRKLKKGAVIVNTARGKVVDEAAMIRALEDGHLSAVGLDVYPDEPAVNPRLLEFPQATLLPHMGAETRDSLHKMEVQALTNIKDYLTVGMGRNVVPEMRVGS